MGILARLFAVGIVMTVAGLILAAVLWTPKDVVLLKRGHRSFKWLGLAILVFGGLGMTVLPPVILVIVWIVTGTVSL